MSIISDIESVGKAMKNVESQKKTFDALKAKAELQEENYKNNLNTLKYKCQRWYAFFFLLGTLFGSGLTGYLMWNYIVGLVIATN